MLQVLDVHWKEHLAEIDHLRGSVGLRAYAQKNPKNEFKAEAYKMFESMLDEIDFETVRVLFSLKISSEEELNLVNNEKKNEDQEMVLNKEQASPVVGEKLNSNKKNIASVKRDEPKIGRNDFVKITNGTETKEVKYKKAKPLIESGKWNIV